MGPQGSPLASPQLRQLSASFAGLGALGDSLAAPCVAPALPGQPGEWASPGHSPPLATAASRGWDVPPHGPGLTGTRGSCRQHPPPAPTKALPGWEKTQKGIQDKRGTTWQILPKIYWHLFSAHILVTASTDKCLPWLTNK